MRSAPGQLPTGADAAARPGATFFYDLASPYAYLASGRVDAALGPQCTWQPILVGALHKALRRVSWGATPALRRAGIAEVERRAADYGLPEIVWPEPYPANSLIAMRAATWAHLHGVGREFAQTAFGMAFAQGIDLTNRAAVLEAARRVDLDARALDRALDGAQLKEALRRATDDALSAGVYGVPTFDAGGLLWWGDHLLAAARCAAECAGRGLPSEPART